MATEVAINPADGEHMEDFIAAQVEFMTKVIVIYPDARQMLKDIEELKRV